MKARPCLQGLCLPHYVKITINALTLCLYPLCLEKMFGIKPSSTWVHTHIEHIYLLNAVKHKDLLRLL